MQKFKLTCDEAVDVEMVDSEEPGGNIIWQSLEQATMVDEWTRITFKVSSGLTDYVVEESYELPQDDREIIHVQVYVDEELQFDEKINSSDGSVQVKLRGSGYQQVKVYFDGVLNQKETHMVQFGN